MRLCHLERTFVQPQHHRTLVLALMLLQPRQHQTMPLVVSSYTHYSRQGKNNVVLRKVLCTPSIRYPPLADMKNYNTHWFSNRFPLIMKLLLLVHLDRQRTKVGCSVVLLVQVAELVQCHIKQLHDKMEQTTSPFMQSQPCNNTRANLLRSSDLKIIRKEIREAEADKPQGLELQAIPLPHQHHRNSPLRLEGFLAPLPRHRQQVVLCLELRLQLQLRLSEVRV